MADFHRAVRSRSLRAFVMMGFGLIAAGAMPPINAAPLLFIGIGGLVWALRDATWRQAFSIGFFWALGFFTSTLYWISLSLMVDIGQFWWLLPVIFLGLPALLSLFPAAACAVARLTGPSRGIGSMLALAGWWGVGEWLRGHVMTGFPWFMAGYVWSGDWPPLLAGLQSVSVIGIYGLSVVTMLAAGLPALALEQGGWPRRLSGPACSLAILAILLIWGTARLSTATDESVPGITLRIVSTNVPHRAEWSPDDAREDFQRVMTLAGSPGSETIAVQIWPEGIVETALNRNLSARRAIAAILPPDGLALVGTTHVEGSGQDARDWNSVMAIDHAASVLGIYDKHHLVPLGEYVPMRWLIGINQIASARYDFSEGPGPATLDLPGMPGVGPVICYEAIFPGDVVDEAKRPGWMINITDDGWFGHSLGPAQHFAIARVRAVEEGLPLIRAANGGISGIVDPWGRVLATLPLDSEAVIDHPLPKASMTSTFYARNSCWLSYFIYFISIVAGILSKRFAIL